jgi:predicted dehydrogenase
MNKKLKVGVIGCGEIAQISHLPYLQELNNFEISALCDISSVVLEELGNRYQVNNRCTDFHDLVKMDLDVVLVSNKNHAAPVIAAMENGKHVLVEKPIAFNLEQADAIVRSAKDNKVKLLVGYMKRFDPAFEVMKRQIKELEKIHLIRVHEFAGTYLINNEIYDLVKASDIAPLALKDTIIQDQKEMLKDIGLERIDLLDAHNIMIHLCIHDINALHGLFGLPEKIISAELFDNNFVSAMMQYENGVNLMWESGNLISLRDWDEQITFFGSNKSLELKFPFPYLKNAPTLINIRENDGNRASSRQITTSFDEAYKREWLYLYDCIVNDKPVKTSPEEAREDLAFAVELLKLAAKII